MFADLKVGARVTRFRNGRPQAIMKVCRVTKTLIITSFSDGPENGRWNRKTGKISGSIDKWSIDSIEATTQEHRDSIKRELLITRVIRAWDIPQIRELDINALKEISQILAKHLKE